MDKNKVAAPAPSDKTREQHKAERKSSVDAIFGEETPVPDKKPDEPKPPEDPNALNQPDDEVRKQIDEVLDGKSKEQPNPDEKPKEEPEKKEEPKEEKKDPPKDPLFDDDDVDFDKPPELEVDDEVKVDDENLDERSRRSIATMRDQLQKAGREAKEAKAELKDAQLQIASKQKELDELREKLNSPSRHAADPMSHPEIKSARDTIMRDRDTFTLRMNSADKAQFNAEFEGMLRDMADAQNAKNPEARDKLLQTLNDKIEATVEPEMVDRVMDLLSSNHGRYTDILAKIENFSELAEKEEVAKKFEGWSKKQKIAAAGIDSLIDLDDELIAANPNTPTAFVAKKVKEDPAWAKRAEQAKQFVVEAFYGKRPLTEEDITRIKEGEGADGMSLDAFIKERSKKSESQQRTAMQRLFIASMIGSQIGPWLQRISELDQKEGARKKEKDALLDITGPPKKKEEPKSDERPTRAQDRPSAVSQVTEVM